MSQTLELFVVFEAVVVALVVARILKVVVVAHLLVGPGSIDLLGPVAALVVLVG